MNRSVWSATCKNDNSADLYFLIMSLVTVGGSANKRNAFRAGQKFIESKQLSSQI